MAVQEPYRPSWWTQFGHSLLQMIPVFAANIGGQALRSAIQDSYAQKRQQDYFAHQNEMQQGRQQFRAGQNELARQTERDIANASNQQAGIRNVASRLLNMGNPQAMGMGAEMSLPAGSPYPEQIRQLPAQLFEPRATAQARGNQENILLKAALRLNELKLKQAYKSKNRERVEQLRRERELILGKAHAMDTASRSNISEQWNYGSKQAGELYEQAAQKLLPMRKKPQGQSVLQRMQQRPGAAPQGQPALVPIQQGPSAQDIRESIIQKYIGRGASPQAAQAAADRLAKQYPPDQLIQMLKGM